MFSFGDAEFYGSVPALREAGVVAGKPTIVAMATTPSGKGYWVLDSAGGLFSFGDTEFYGSLLSIGVAGGAVGIAR